MKCSMCGDKVTTCDQCVEIFKSGDDLYCEGGEFHFCTHDCWETFIVCDITYEEATVIGDEE